MSRRRHGPTPRPEERGRFRDRLDLSTPIPREQQLVRRTSWRVPLAVMAVGIVVALAAAVFVLPVRDWWRQADELDRRQRELTTLEDVNNDLQAEIERLQTPAGIAEAARQELGFADPGERRLSMVERGDLPMTLPAGWPYSVVTGVLTARTNLVELGTPPG